MIKLYAAALCLKSLVAAVRSLAEASPDNIYCPEIVDVGGNGRNCFYSKGDCSDGSKGCIIGQALVKLGFDVARLDDNPPNVEGLLAGWRDYAEIENDTSELQCWLAEVQESQDLGETWGQAVTRANDLFAVSV